MGNLTGVKLGQRPFRRSKMCPVAPNSFPIVTGPWTNGCIEGTLQNSNGGIRYHPPREYQPVILPSTVCWHLGHYWCYSCNPLSLRGSPLLYEKGKIYTVRAGQYICTIRHARLISTKICKYCPTVDRIYTERNEPPTKCEIQMHSLSMQIYMSVPLHRGGSAGYPPSCVKMRNLKKRRSTIPEEPLILQRGSTFAKKG